MSRPNKYILVIGEFQSTEAADRATLRALVNDLRSSEGDLAGYASTLERFLAGYPSPPPHRRKSGLPYWIAAMYWLLREGDALAANRVAAWCRDQGIEITSQTVQRTARTVQGREARKYIAASVSNADASCARDDIIEGHRLAIAERILAWHRKDDDIRVPRPVPPGKRREVS